MFAAGDRFSYCNSGYVVLALIAERVSGRSFQSLVEERVCAPAGMHDEGRGYGLGFWLDATGPAVLLEGSDAGVSFRSMFGPDECAFTVISNVSNGAWTVAGELEHLLVSNRSR
jgi:CubicO group peptidase (beta-lactamase class C family)